MLGNSHVFSYYLPESGKETLKIFDMVGNEVVTLVNENQNADIHTPKVNSAGFSTGAYSYQIEITGSTKHFTKTRQMIVGR